MTLANGSFSKERLQPLSWQPLVWQEQLEGRRDEDAIMSSWVPWYQGSWDFLVGYDNCTVYPGPCSTVSPGSFLQMCSLEECSLPKMLLFLKSFTFCPIISCLALSTSHTCLSAAPYY